ncbi:hypothetical protein DM01DRAFT_1334301 [Hesseltinella vesiculosa]|uniref:Uncharacterized protein n=1 Tax=Hesseltinella vesiculosa TaxID=101127 RepID=A0A1X2GLH5_9FUNG|nr:hypothetical protein DM01DRAFT_1334301 [Hesseltinella vesiculosa]
MMMILKNSRRLMKIAQPTFVQFRSDISDPPAKKIKKSAIFIREPPRPSDQNPAAPVLSNLSKPQLSNLSKIQKFLLYIPSSFFFLQFT